MLQEIINNFKKKSWLRMCTLRNINKWSLIKYVGEPVYPSRYLIKPGLELRTRVCLKCNTELDLGIYKGTFTANCKCAADGSAIMTADKLSTILRPDQVAIAVSLVQGARKKGLPNTLEYWISRGVSREQAAINVHEVQRNRSLKSPAALKGARGYSPRTVEYWIDKKGLSLEEAIAKVKQTQTTNGLEFYENKYGPIIGLSKFNERMQKWLQSDGNRKMIANRSKIALSLFDQLGKGFYGNNEKTVRGKTSVHRVDFVLGKKIIEFYGDYWHGNPTLYSANSMIRNKKITDVWEHDLKKVQDLREKGYEVLIVWEHDYRTSPESVLSLCREHLNEY
jgi:G:T-mismatch repair DNA endonuclease (very short patch repair protein)